jgi:hypothetical protein
VIVPFLLEIRELLVLLCQLHLPNSCKNPYVSLVSGVMLQARLPYVSEVLVSLLWLDVVACKLVKTWWTCCINLLPFSCIVVAVISMLCIVIYCFSKLCFWLCLSNFSQVCIPLQIMPFFLQKSANQLCDAWKLQKNNHLLSLWQYA